MAEANERRAADFADTGITPGFLSTLISHGYLLTGGFLISVLTARFLTPSGKGQYTLIFDFILILALLASFGLAQANVYYAGKRDERIIFGNSLFFSLVTGLAFGAALLALRGPLSSIIPALKPVYLVVAALLLPIHLLTIFSRHILLGEGDIKGYNFLRNFQMTLLTGGIIVFTAILKSGLPGAVVAIVLSITLSLPVSLYKVRDKISISVSLDQLAQSLRFGVKSYLALMAQFLSFRLDVFLVAFFINTANVGYYAVSASIGQAIWSLPTSLSVVLFSTSSLSEDSRMNKVTPQAGRVVVAAVFALACLIFFFAPQLVSLVFGPNYLDAVTPLRVLLPGIIAMSSYRILVGDLAGRGRPEIGTYSTFIALAATISLDLVLIPSFGITGAALASSIAYSLAAGFMLANYVRITGVSARELFLLRLTDLYSIRESLANRLPLAGRSPEDVT